ncbi:MAG: hypothetical protein NYU90_05480 [Aigarchaeota archaeon]|nr:hypothetical protein [Candidatus Calditenuis fumarioli]
MGSRIVQILGSIGYESYWELHFSIEGRRYGPYKLVASALVEHLRENGKDCSVTLLLPESLVTDLAGTLEEAEELLRDKEKLAREAERRLRDLDLVRTDFEVRVLQGVGNYPLRRDSKTTVEFVNYIDNVSSYALIGMTEAFDRDEELYFCTSTGHNAYLLALQMALATYYAYREFIRQSAEGSGRLDLYTVYHPKPTVGRTTPVEVERTSHRAFFSFPQPRKELIADRPDESIDLRRELSELMGPMQGERSRAQLAFNAVRFNVPLLLTYLDPPDGEKVLRSLREALERIERKKRISKDGDVLRVSRIRVLRSEVSAWVIIAGLSAYLSRVVRSVRATGGRIGALLGTVKRFYEEQDLHLNGYVLEHEIEQIRERAACLRPGERKPLSEVLQLKGSANMRRNFFAHAGLLAEWTLVRRLEDCEIALEYDGSNLETIKKWVQNPVA